MINGLLHVDWNLKLVSKNPKLYLS